MKQQIQIKNSFVNSILNIQDKKLRQRFSYQIFKNWGLFPKIYSTTSEVNQPQNTTSCYLIFISRMRVFYLTDSLLKGLPKSSPPFPIQAQACMQVKQTLFTKQKRIKLHFSSFHCSPLCVSTFINHREKYSFVSPQDFCKLKGQKSSCRHSIDCWETSLRFPPVTTE